MTSGGAGGNTGRRPSRRAASSFPRPRAGQVDEVHALASQMRARRARAVRAAAAPCAAAPRSPPCAALHAQQRLRAFGPGLRRLRHHDEAAVQPAPVEAHDAWRAATCGADRPSATAPCPAGSPLPSVSSRWPPGSPPRSPPRRAAWPAGVASGRIQQRPGHQQQQARDGGMRNQRQQRRRQSHQRHQQQGREHRRQRRPGAGLEVARSGSANRRTGSTRRSRRRCWTGPAP